MDGSPAGSGPRSPAARAGVGPRRPAARAVDRPVADRGAVARGPERARSAASRSRSAAAREDRGSVRRTILRFAAAVADGDERAACALMSREAREEIVRRAAGLRCPTLVDLVATGLSQQIRNSLRHVQIGHIDVHGFTAQVALGDIASTAGGLEMLHVNGARTVTLTRRPGASWRIAL
jgi:hypothetical protein